VPFSFLSVFFVLFFLLVFFGFLLTFFFPRFIFIFYLDSIAEKYVRSISFFEDFFSLLILVWIFLFFFC